MRALASAISCILLVPLAAGCSSERMSLSASCAEYRTLTVEPIETIPEADAKIYANLTDALPRMHKAVAAQLEVAVEAWGPDKLSDASVDKTTPALLRLAELCR
ncbi:hypothetical protein ACX80I_06610 [Arthrobacter sp. MDT3-44]